MALLPALPVRWRRDHRAPLPPADSGRRRLGSPRTSTLLGAARLGFGGVMLARPATLPRVLGVDSATAERASWPLRMVGAREAALGLGCLAAVRTAGEQCRWLLAAAIADAGDAAAVAGALRGRHVATLPALAIIAFAAAGAATEIAAARTVTRRPGP